MIFLSIAPCFVVLKFFSGKLKRNDNKTPPQIYVGSSWSSDSIALNSSISESNVYNCNITGLGFKFILAV